MDIYIAFLKGYHGHLQKSGENSLVASSWVTMQKSKRSLIKNFYAISYTVGLYRCWSFLYVPLQTKVSFICRERRDKLKSVSHNDRWHTKICLPYIQVQCLQVFDWTDILSDLWKSFTFKYCWTRLIYAQIAQKCLTLVSP